MIRYPKLFHVSPSHWRYRGGWDIRQSIDGWTASRPSHESITAHTLDKVIRAIDSAPRQEPSP